MSCLCVVFNAMFSAKALYNNISDAPEELSFSKGDILDVIEKDANGWWMCSFKGKVGIAPGNRLQPLPSAPVTTGKGASPSGRNSPSLSQTLAHAEKLRSGLNVNSSKKSSSDVQARPSWHSNSKVVVPKKLGSMYVYDTPNHVHQDYDVPPSRLSRQNRDAKQVTSEETGKSSLTRISDALQSYDVPSALRSLAQTYSDPSGNYDRLPAQTRKLSQPPDSSVPKSSAAITYDIPRTSTTSGFDLDPVSLSNRLSTLSVLSTGSRSSACSGHSSLSGSISTQSSMDVSFQDVYDVPPCSRLLSGLDAAACHLYPVTEHGLLPKSNDGTKTPYKRCMQSSMTSPCVQKEIVRQSSVGQHSNQKLHVERDSYLEDYSIPRCGASQVCSIPGGDTSQGSGDSGISMSQVDCFSSHCSCEIYDTPRKLTDSELQGNCNMLKREENTYDVPVSQQRSHNSDGKSMSDERVGVDSCMDMSGSNSQMTDSTNTLIALQSNILFHGTKLIDLINKDYLSSHQHELSQIKLTCLALKTAVKEVIEFGNLLLSRLSDPLSDKIFQLLEKVRVQYNYLSRHIEKLITTQWSMKHEDCGSGEISELDDNLNTIQMLTETISARLLALTRFILQNSSLLIGEISEISGYDCASSDLARALNEESKCRSPLPSNERISKACSDSAVQNRPLPPIPLHDSALEDSNNSKHLSSKSATHGTNHASSSGTNLQTCNLSEWNDECDYVSIANEAEKEMKAQEKLLGQQPLSVESVSGSCPEATDGFVADGYTKIGLMTENNSNSLEQMDKLKNVEELPGLTNSLSCPIDGQRVENASAVSVASDQQLMAYYIEQIETNFTIVDTAVREFFQMLFNDRVTAKEFLLRSKFVILAAHKLVYIGDTITRNSIHSSAPQSDIAQMANRLCDILKETVSATKMSALNFPQNLTQQNLTECMKAVLQASRLLCEAIRVNSA